MKESQYGVFLIGIRGEETLNKAARKILGGEVMSCRELTLILPGNGQMEKMMTEKNTSERNDMIMIRAIKCSVLVHGSWVQMPVTLNFACVVL